MGDFFAHVEVHMALAGAALALAAIVGLPLGAAISNSAFIRPGVLAAINTARVIPSLAVLMLMLPILGVGFRPALIALALLAIPPIAVNTDLGLRGVPAATLDAARGLGLRPAQVARRVAWPLALPAIVTGIRTASVEVIASATLATFVGGGGLGEYITDGLANADNRTLLLGGFSVAALALATDALIGAVARRLQARTAVERISP